MQAKHGIVTPAIVKESYQTPISGQQIRSEKVENMQLSEAVDQVIGDYLAYCEKRNRAYKNGRTPVPERLKLLDSEKEAVGERIQEQVRKANVLFDRKDHRKTFLLMLNEYLLNFLQLAFTGHPIPSKSGWAAKGGMLNSCNFAIPWKMYPCLRLNTSSLTRYITICWSSIGSFPIRRPSTRSA